jgi:hypothetical protein
MEEQHQVDQQQKPRERSFISELLLDWRPTREQVLWAVRIVIVLVVVLGFLTLIGLPFGISLWEWVKLLIVPAAIAAGGIWFNRQQRRRELEVENQRAQDEALQAYLDQMGQLMLDKEPSLLHSGEDDEIRSLARAWTLTVLTRLDPGRRKRSVLQFLYEAGLIDKDRTIVDLTGADLSGAALSRAYLNDVDMSIVYRSKANLGSTNLSDADLKGATVAQEQLEQAKSLKGATMPNGQKYEDWLKENEGRGDNRKSHGPS